MPQFKASWIQEHSCVIECADIKTTQAQMNVFVASHEKFKLISIYAVDYVEPPEAPKAADIKVPDREWALRRPCSCGCEDPSMAATVWVTPGLSLDDLVPK